MPYLHAVTEIPLLPEGKRLSASPAVLRYHIFDTAEEAEAYAEEKNRFAPYPDFPLFAYPGGRHWDTRILYESNTIDHRKAAS